MVSFEAVKSEDTRYDRKNALGTIMFAPTRYYSQKVAVVVFNTTHPGTSSLTAAIHLMRAAYRGLCSTTQAPVIPSLVPFLTDLTLTP